jgi:hypothetical protein
MNKVASFWSIWSDTEYALFLFCNDFDANALFGETVRNVERFNGYIPRFSILTDITEHPQFSNEVAKILMRKDWPGTLGVSMFINGPEELVLILIQDNLTEFDVSKHQWRAIWLDNFRYEPWVMTRALDLLAIQTYARTNLFDYLDRFGTNADLWQPNPDPDDEKYNDIYPAPRNIDATNIDSNVSVSMARRRLKRLLDGANFKDVTSGEGEAAPGDEARNITPYHGKGGTKPTHDKEYLNKLIADLYNQNPPPANFSACARTIQEKLKQGNKPIAGMSTLRDMASKYVQTLPVD